MSAEIGLTGSIGSGKSTAARLFRERGAVIIDADALAREAMAEPGVVGRIAEAFGDEVVSGGVVDRARLARRVFDDAEARARLEAIVHPRVAELRRTLAAEARAASPAPALIVHDVPLLFEAGLDDAMDVVVVVDAPLDARIARVAARSGLEPEEVRRRERAQMPPAEKRTRADVVLDNAHDVASLARQIDAVWPRLVAARRPG